MTLLVTRSCSWREIAFARPSLNAHKRRKLELAAGATSRRGPVRGTSHDYHVKQLRDQERALVEHSERAYEVMVSHWESPRPCRPSSLTARTVQ